MSDQKALNLLAKGAGITAIALFGSKILTYLFKVILARFLGPNAYGKFSLALMVMGIATTMSLLSLNSAIKKFIPEYRQSQNIAKIKGVILSSMYITVPLSIIAGLIMFFGAEYIAIEIFNNSKLIPLIKIMSISPLFANIKSILYDTTKAYDYIIYDALILKIFQSLLKITIATILIIAGYNVIGAAWAAVISTVAVSITGIYIVEKKIGPILTSNEKPSFETKKLLKYSYPLLLSGMIGTVMGWADTALLGYYMTETQVGFYNVALPTATLIMLPHQAIGSLGLTTLSELKERNDRSLEPTLQTATRWVFSLVFPAFLILLLFSEQILKVLWGSQYTVAATTTSILAIGYLVGAGVGRVGDLLSSKGYTRYLLYNNIAALTLNLILNVILIPVYGIIGAAIATATSTILTNTLMFAEVWRKEKVVSIPHTEILKITLTGLLALLPVIGLDRTLFVSTPYWFLIPAGLIYGLIYVGLYLAIVGLGEEEKEVFLRIGEIINLEDYFRKVLSVIT